MKKTAKQKANACPSLQRSAGPSCEQRARTHRSLGSPVPVLPERCWAESLQPHFTPGSGAAQWYLCDPLIWNVLIKCSQYGRRLFIFLWTNPNSSSCIMQCCLKNTSDTGLNLPFWEGNIQASPVASHQAWACWRGYCPAPCHRQTDGRTDRGPVPLPGQDLGTPGRHKARWAPLPSQPAKHHCQAVKTCEPGP